MKKFFVGLLIGMIITPSLSFADEGWLEPIRIISRSSERIAKSLEHIELELQKCK